MLQQQRSDEPVIKCVPRVKQKLLDNNIVPR